MDQRPSPTVRTPAQALGMAVVSVCLLAYFLWQVAPIASDLFKGAPSIEQLRRVDGRVVGWRDCHPVGRRSSGENVTLVSDAGSVSVAVPCVLPSDMLADGKQHHMTVLLQDTRSVGSLVYDIELDGRKLLAYSDEKHERAGAGRVVMVAFGVVLAMLLLVVVAAVQAFFRSLRNADDEDWHEPHAEPDMGPPREAGLDKRAAVLAMLAEGNSPHAVASVFGVPETLVVQWAGEPRHPAAATVAPSRHRPTSFEATLVYESRLWMRVTIAVFCLLVALAVAPGILWRLRESQGAPETLINLLMLAVMTLGTAIPYRMTRIRLICGQREIRSYGLFGSQALAYGEVGGFSLEPDRLSTGRGQYIEGERLTIVGTGRCPALSIFVYPSRPLDPRILERLREVGDARP